MKKLFMMTAMMLMASAAAFAQSKVYLTREITSEALVKIYKTLGVQAQGRVAVKVSTSEGSNPNFLKPELIKDLVFEVDGTIVECNTAYGNDPADLLRRIDKQHGTHTIDHAEQIGLGSKKYELLNIDQ